VQTHATTFNDTLYHFRRHNSVKETTRAERKAVRKSVSYVPLTKNFAKVDLQTAGSYNGLNNLSSTAMSRLTNVCIGVSDLSNICYPSCETQSSSYHVMHSYRSDKDLLSRHNSTLVKWAQDLKPAEVQPQLQSPRKTAKFVVAINLNNLKKASMIDEAAQTDNSEDTPMGKLQNIFDESIVKDTLELYEQQLQPLKHFVRDLKDQLKAMNIAMEVGVVGPRDRCNDAGNQHRASCSNLEKSQTTTSRHSAAGGESYRDEFERESIFYAGLPEEDVDDALDRGKHLQEADDLTAEKVWNFIYKQGDGSEEEDREPLTIDPDELEVYNNIR
jgi:hypothetical protein